MLVQNNKVVIWIVDYCVLYMKQCIRIVFEEFVCGGLPIRDNLGVIYILYDSSCPDLQWVSNGNFELQVYRGTIRRWSTFVIEQSQHQITTLWITMTWLGGIRIHLVIYIYIYMTRKLSFLTAGVLMCYSNTNVSSR